MVTTMVTVNGAAVKVSNAFSCGPGCEPHTYELAGSHGRKFITKIGKDWQLEQPGQFPRKVEVVIG